MELLTWTATEKAAKLGCHGFSVFVGGKAKGKYGEAIGRCTARRMYRALLGLVVSHTVAKAVFRALQRSKGHPLRAVSTTPAP